MASENYLTLDLAAKARKQAVKVWMIGSAVVLIWVLLIVAAPATKLTGFGSFSDGLYHLFRFACHQIPERSFHIGGEKFAVCSRCFGVYFGLLAGFAAYPLWRVVDEVEPLPRFWLFLALVPISIDWALTMFGIWENTHLTRFVTGLILGVACATYIVPALVEVTRNLTIFGRRRVRG